MGEFLLKTRTGRLFYAEALLSCIDRRTISEDQACQDLKEMGYSTWRRRRRLIIN